MGGDSLRAKQKVLMALRAGADGKERRELALAEAIQVIDRER